MVYMVCQNKARGEEAVSKIQSSTSNQTKCSLGGMVFGFFFIFMVPTHRKEYEMNFAVNVLGTYGMTELLLPLLEKSQPYACVALAEKWAQKYADKGIGFYVIHLGWVATVGVAMSLSSFSKSYVLLSSFNIHISFQLYY
ncbi:putative NAD(P)-binding domain superfamily [Helianthus annuus]|nr:putative NAD(P)-binding domain superfamily [Helianthus annuus]KAJ0684276.1 putative NAD(P)-binding domain superfamily [Helianthus annuus]KAJ0688228.1 putative NAD(P)-binding domain superfamily [Helianthus annuus]KAJ0873850.1 putative NAD(P)-binding domain superfamily [Helianthus annuus]